MRGWATLGLRHILRHRRRSLATFAAVALGCAAVNLLGGFTHYVYQGLEESFIYAQGKGHLTVRRRPPPGKAAPAPGEGLLTAEEQAAVAAAARRLPSFIAVAPQLQVSGLVSNGEESAIFLATGRVPSDLRRFRREAGGFIARMRLFEGLELEDALPRGVGASNGLARRLGLGPGAGAVVIAPTVEGRMNALDVEVRQRFEAFLEPMNDKTMTVTLALAQELYDTRGADALAVLLARGADPGAARDALAGGIRAAGLGEAVEVRTWLEENAIYGRTRAMFTVIFVFVYAIVLVIVLLSMLNTVGMAVVERTVEIGTMRALGLRRRGVVALFAAESALLGCAGAVAGVLITASVSALVAAAEPTWVPPTYAAPVPLEIHLVPAYLAASALLVCALSVAAAAVPARRAARLGIPEALGHA